MTRHKAKTMGSSRIQQLVISSSNLTRFKVALVKQTIQHNPSIKENTRENRTRVKITSARMLAYSVRRISEK
jgi:hypothetical protein